MDIRIKSNPLKMTKGIHENLITNTTFINKIHNFLLKTKNMTRTSASAT